MLFLSRKIGETIVIGEQVLITVVAVRGSRVQLGITAPNQICIRRENVTPRSANGETMAHKGAPPGEIA
jgi:carbon storage regulator